MMTGTSYHFNPLHPMTDPWDDCIFTYMYPKSQPFLRKYTVYIQLSHGSYGHETAAVTMGVWIHIQGGMWKAMDTDRSGSGDLGFVEETVRSWEFLKGHTPPPMPFPPAPAKKSGLKKGVMKPTI